MQRVQDQDNGINIKFGSKKSRKGDYKLVSQDATKERQNNYNGTNKHGMYVLSLFIFCFFVSYRPFSSVTRVYSFSLFGSTIYLAGNALFLNLKRKAVIVNI